MKTWRLRPWREPMPPSSAVLLQRLNQAMAQAEGAEKGRLRAQWDELFKVVHSEKLGEMAAEFDRVHSVQRALDVGALNCIIPPANLRPYLIHAVERGIVRVEQSEAAKRLAGRLETGTSEEAGTPEATVEEAA